MNDTESSTDRRRSHPQGATDAAEAPARRKPFAPPRLERHDTLAAVTAEQVFNFGGS